MPGHPAATDRLGVPSPPAPSSAPIPATPAPSFLSHLLRAIVSQSSFLGFSLVFVTLSGFVAWCAFRSLEEVVGSVKWNGSKLDRAAASVIPYLILQEACLCYVFGYVISSWSCTRKQVPGTVVNVAVMIAVLTGSTAGDRRTSRPAMLYGMMGFFMIRVVLNLAATFMFGLNFTEFLTLNQLGQADALPEDQKAAKLAEMRAWSFMTKMKTYIPSILTTGVTLAIAHWIVAASVEFGRSLEVYLILTLVIIPLTQLMLAHFVMQQVNDHRMSAILVLNYALIQIPMKVLRFLKANEIQYASYWALCVTSVSIERILPRFLMMVDKFRLARAQRRRTEAANDMEAGENALKAKPVVAAASQNTTAVQLPDIQEHFVTLRKAATVEAVDSVLRTEPPGAPNTQKTKEVDAGQRDPLPPVGAGHGDNKRKDVLGPDEKQIESGSAVSVNNTRLQALRPDMDRQASQSKLSTTQRSFVERHQRAVEELGENTKRVLTAAVDRVMEIYSINRNDYTLSNYISTLTGIAFSVILPAWQRPARLDEVLLAGAGFLGMQMVSETACVWVESWVWGIPTGKASFFTGVLGLGLVMQLSANFCAAYGGFHRIFEATPVAVDTLIMDSHIVASSDETTTTTTPGENTPDASTASLAPTRPASIAKSDLPLDTAGPSSASPPSSATAIDIHADASSLPADPASTSLAKHDAELAAVSHRNMTTLNAITSQIGMGPYQWLMFWVCGFGWFADNMWLQALALVLPEVKATFGITDNKTASLGTSMTLTGMIFGASVWGILSDVIGRRPAFLLTLLIGGVFGGLAALSPNFVAYCCFLFLMGFGIGGNLPVDGSLFLEFIPSTHQSLLTLLSVFWPFGQLYASLFAWWLLPTYPCDASASPPCAPLRSGWRFVLVVLSLSTLLMLATRVAFVRMLESPKYLLARGRVADAVSVLRELARGNGKDVRIEEDIFERLDEIEERKRRHAEMAGQETGSVWAQELERFWRLQLVPLFERKRVWTTMVVWGIWMAVALAYVMFYAFLPEFIKGSEDPLSTNETYRNYFLQALSGVPGSVLGYYLVDTRFGRKGTMAASGLGVGAFIFCFTTTKNSNIQLAFNCVASFLANLLYGVIYAFTPEAFDTAHRGTAVGCASALNRITGAVAPYISGALLDINFNIPLYVSAAFFALVGVFSLLLPIETRGRAAM
ncbi:hypothetical protein HDU96_005502 [Phlyctochytrium bullatum]|nr:hypothetical protein HDU96_005502 [Phlyctochytrium bullatum]